MKKVLNIIGLVISFLFFSASCNAAGPYSFVVSDEWVVEYITSESGKTYSYILSQEGNNPALIMLSNLYTDGSEATQHIVDETFDYYMLAAKEKHANDPYIIDIEKTKFFPCYVCHR